MVAELAFGISAAERPDHARLGAEVERLGYTELWTNDTRRGDGIRALAEMAPGTSGLRLAVGVVALTEHDPTAILARLRGVDLPLHRLTLGVGAGSSASRDLVRSGVEQLRARLPDVPIAVAAVGPRMLRLAGELADAVVATWALPDRVGWIRERVAEGADAAGRTPPRLVLYVRTAVGQGGESRLRAEMERYASYGPHYARAFAAQPNQLIGVAADRDAVASALRLYREVADTVVVRAIPYDDSVDAWLEVARAATGET